MLENMEKSRPTYRTDSQLRQYRLVGPGEKSYKVNDDIVNGLYVAVSTKSKVFRLDFMFAGKKKTLTLGKYQKELSLEQARAKAKEAKAMLASGKDPALAKQSEKQANIESAIAAKQAELAKVQTFEKTALEYLKVWQVGRRESTVNNVVLRINKHLIPVLGDKPIVAIKQKDILNLLDSIRPIISVYTTSLGLLKNIFRYAMAREYISQDPLLNIDTLLPKVEVNHNNFPATTVIVGIGAMLNQIDSFLKSCNSSIYIKIALKLLRYLPLRPSELISLQWSDVDLDNATIYIDKARCKTKKDVTYYLSDQAIQLFNCAREMCISKYVFPSYGKNGHFEKDSFSKMLKNAGLKDKQTAHGFRAVFSSLVNTVNPNADKIVEALLGHKIQGEVAGAYNRSNYEHQKRLLIQWYSDAIDALASGQSIPKFNPEILVFD